MIDEMATIIGHIQSLHCCEVFINPDRLGWGNGDYECPVGIEKYEQQNEYDENDDPSCFGALQCHSCYCS